MDYPPVSEMRFSLFRTVLGIYLLFYLWMVWPDAGHLYSMRGVPQHEPFLYGPGINWLRYAENAAEVREFLGCVAGAVVFLALGVFRRIAALAVFYGLFCMFTMGDYTTCVANPYIGWAVLACSLVPSGERWSVDHLWMKPVPGAWRYPPLLFWGSWAVFAVSYTSSGIDKCWHNPKWFSGIAVPWMLDSPFSRRWWFKNSMQKILQGSAGFGATWFIAVVELLALPFCFNRIGRPLVWILLTVMHVGVLMLFNIPVVSTGMLVFHLFVFDERWLRRDFWRLRAD